jgi:hypothetical protein
MAFRFMVVGIMNVRIVAAASQTSMLLASHKQVDPTLVGSNMSER